MTRHRSFKQLVRTRMAKTGESYTAARGMLLTATPATATSAQPAPVLTTSDERIRARTGRGWEEWFDLLDEAGMTERPHREIARWVAELQGVVPLAWEAQAVTVSYERARVGRAVGEHPEGFAVTASRTIAAPAERLFDVVVDAALRDRWTEGARMRERTSTRPRSARFDWVDDDTRVNVTLQPKGESTTVTVEHERLADSDSARRQKLWWRERLSTLKAELEGGHLDA